MTVLKWIIAAIPAIISGYILWQMKEHQKQVDERDAERAKREFLTLENINAQSSAIKELYVCVLLGRTPNGELEQAFKYMQDSKHELEEYLRELASKK